MEANGAINTRVAPITRRALLSGAVTAVGTAILAACGSDASATNTVPALSAPLTNTGAVLTVAATSAAATTTTLAPTVAATAGATSAMTPAANAVAAATGASTMTAPQAAGSAMACADTFREATAIGTPAGVQAPDFRGKFSLKTLNIAFIPGGGDSDQIFDRYKELLAYIKQSLGMEIKGTVGSSYTAVIEAMKVKKVELAYYGPFSYILAHQVANAQVLVLPADAMDKLTTYTSQIITYPDSPLQTLADIKGKSFSFVDPASTSGHLVPSYTLQQKAVLKESDYKPKYAGSHPSSYQTVVNKKVDAGAVASTTLASGILNGTVDQSKYRVLDNSFDIPSSPIGYRGDLSQSDADILQKLYLSLNDLPRTSALAKAIFMGDTVKYTVGDDHVYDELRKIPPTLGIDIATLS